MVSALLHRHKCCKSLDNLIALFQHYARERLRGDTVGTHTRGPGVHKAWIVPSRTTADVC
jgi:hypothetical protein